MKTTALAVLLAFAGGCVNQYRVDRGELADRRAAERSGERPEPLAGVRVRDGANVWVRPEAVRRVGSDGDDALVKGGTMHPLTKAAIAVAVVGAVLHADGGLLL